MTADKKYSTLHGDLTRGLVPHIDILTEKFKTMKLICDEEVSNLPTPEKKVDYLLDKINNKKEQNNESQHWNVLISYMKSNRSLSELVDKMEDETIASPEEETNTHGN